MNGGVTGTERQNVNKSITQSTTANLKKFGISPKNLVTSSKRAAHSPLQAVIRPRPLRTHMDQSISSTSEGSSNNSEKTRFRAFHAEMKATAHRVEHMFASMNLSSSDDSTKSSWNERAHFVAPRSKTMVSLITGNQYDAVYMQEKKRDPLSHDSDDDCIFQFCPEPVDAVPSNDYQSFSDLKFKRETRT